jgi:hypothetical protein
MSVVTNTTNLHSRIQVRWLGLLKNVIHLINARNIQHATRIVDTQDQRIKISDTKT